MKQLVVSLAFAVAMSVLAGCGGAPDDSGELAPDIASASTSETANTPTSEQTPPTPPPPKRPVSANGDTPEAAVAAVKYWVDALNHAAMTGDVSALKDASTDDCVPCIGYIKANSRPNAVLTSREIWELLSDTIAVAPTTPIQVIATIEHNDGAGIVHTELKFKVSDDRPRRILGISILETNS